MGKLDKAQLRAIRRRLESTHYPAKQAIADVRLLLEHLDALEIEQAMPPVLVQLAPADHGATCKYCGKQMLDPETRTCRMQSVEYPDKLTMQAVRYENPNVSIEERPFHRCHDCGVALGGFHHPGCDMETCPRCGGQLISCGCLDQPEAEEVN